MAGNNECSTHVRNKLHYIIICDRFKIIITKIYINDAVRIIIIIIVIIKNIIVNNNNMTVRLRTDYIMEFKKPCRTRVLIRGLTCIQF